MRTSPTSPEAEAAALPHPPGPVGGAPVRSILAFRRDVLEMVERMQRRHGDVVRWRVGTIPFYLVADPELVRDVLVTRHRLFIKSRALQRARVLLGEGLLTSEGDFHLRQRRLAQPAFHRERIAALGEEIAAISARTGEAWRAGATVDVGREMNRMALAIAGRTLFGAAVEEEADEIGRALTDALGLFTRLSNPLAPLLDRLPVPATRRFHRARERLDATILRIVEERRRSGAERHDLLGLLLAARDEEGDGGGMTDAQLRDETLTLFLAGHETTANALSWAWHLLGANPEAEARFHAEIDAVLGGRLPGAEDVAALPYTRGVFAETMRLFPPAYLIGREPREEIALGGFRIRRGSVVLVSPWLAHRDPRFWRAPLEFLPERWTPGGEAALPRFAYFPFGGGPRKCIAEGFAWMEGILALATLGRRWRLRPVPGVVPRQKPLITLRASGLAMTLEPRG